MITQPRVLIIDDSAPERELVRIVLTGEGFQVDTAERGEEGLSKACETRYDAILLDYRLPDINGLEVLHGLRAAGVSTPVVALTGYGSEDVATRFLTEGAMDYIAKDKLFELRLVQVLRDLREASVRGVPLPRVLGARKPLRVLLLSRALWLARLVKEAFDGDGEVAVVDMAVGIDEGERAARSHTHDIVLVDADLPAGGLRALEAVRRTGEHAPALALTRAEAADGTREFVAAGARDFLDKDQLTPDQLRKSVDALLGRRSPRSSGRP